MTDEERRLAELVARLDQRLEALEERADDFLTRWEFAPVRLLAYGLAGILLTAVALGLSRLVLK